MIREWILMNDARRRGGICTPRSAFSLFPRLILTFWYFQ